MLRENLPCRINLRAEILRDANDDAANHVPHRLPRPPSTTTSNAIKRRLGPISGSKFVHTDMQQAADMTVSPTTPIATP